MKYLTCLLTLLALTPLAAVADPHKREGGHGHHRGHAYKEEYWVGNCKIERKVNKHGDYKEERKCHGPEVVHGHAPAVVLMPPAAVVQPGIVIQGTVRLP